MVSGSRISPDPRHQVACTAAGFHLVSTTTFSFSGTVSRAIWESIGPTGSGATHIWTALDDVPSDADWIDLRIVGHVGDIVAPVSSPQQQNDIHARENGTFPGPSNINMMFRSGIYVSFSGATAQAVYVESTSYPRIKVVSGVFDVYWVYTTTASTVEAVLGLVGYGWNRPAP